MAARGINAKAEVERKIASSFGSDYIGNIGGKIYVWANDGNEKVQVALSLTCPKTSVDANNATVISSSIAKDCAWDDIPAASQPQKTTEISQEEMDNIERLMKKFGL